MRDPRIDKLARTLVRFSTQVRDGDNVLIQATDADRELVKALIEEVYRAGGKPFVWLRDAQIERALLLGCTAEQLELRARADAMLMERMQVYIGFTGILNRAEHSDVPAEKHTYEIGYLIGEEEYLNHGIGKIIIRILEEKIMEAGGKEISADPSEENIISIKALLSNGFKKKRDGDYRKVLG